MIVYYGSNMVVDHPDVNHSYPSYDQIAFITQAAVDGLLTFRSSQEVSL